MNKFIKVLTLIAIVLPILLFTTGCGSGSVTGKYYRDFGDYTSSTMYIDLKRDMTYESDGTAPGVWSQGTYEIDGSIITFIGESAWLDVLENADGIATGSIGNRTITIDGAIYRK